MFMHEYSKYKCNILCIYNAAIYLSYGENRLHYKRTFQVRESFMRQYLEEEQEEENGLAKAHGVGGLEDSTISYHKRRPIKLLTALSHPRNADYEKKKTGVSNIIW